MRTANASDIPLLLDLMAEFYAESGYALDRPHAARAFEALLADERLGRIWIIEAGPKPAEMHAPQPGLAPAPKSGRAPAPEPATAHANIPAGHLVLVFRFAMEYGGPIACLDDLYVRPAYRNRGLASAALAESRAFCADHGIRAITVETGPGNAPAQKVYGRAGFSVLADRQLLALPLDKPAHLE